jgi:hypothetical protein
MSSPETIPKNHVPTCSGHGRWFQSGPDWTVCAFTICGIPLRVSGRVQAWDFPSSESSLAIPILKPPNDTHILPLIHCGVLRTQLVALLPRRWGM